MLRYQYLLKFEKDMVALARKNRIFTKKPVNLWTSNDDKLLVYQKGDLVFAFNFHPERSHDGFFLPVADAGEYEVVLATDNFDIGGHGRISNDQIYEAAKHEQGNTGFRIYLPSRTAVVLKKRRK